MHLGNRISWMWCVELGTGDTILRRSSIQLNAVEIIYSIRKTIESPFHIKSYLVIT